MLSSHLPPLSLSRAWSSSHIASLEVTLNDLISLSLVIDSALSYTQWRNDALRGSHVTMKDDAGNNYSCA